MRTDFPSTFEENSLIKVVGADMSAVAAKSVYEQSGISPDDVDVVELRDCFTSNEISTYEALGLASVGGAERFVMAGDTRYGGRVRVHPSGGLLVEGQTNGATGLATCVELVWQRRGGARLRPV